MARKTLLTESEIRQFMKLANIEPLQEMGYDYQFPVCGTKKKRKNPDARYASKPTRRRRGRRSSRMRWMRPMPAPEGEEAGEEMDAWKWTWAPARNGPEGGEEMEMDMDLGDASTR